MTKWLFLALAIACEVSASLSLKAALDRPVLYAVVVCGYVASMVTLVKVLRLGVPLGVAYGIWGALGVVATAVLSSLVFDEELTTLMGIGMAVAVAGVLLVDLGSRPAPAAPRKQ